MGSYNPCQVPGHPNLLEASCCLGQEGGVLVPKLWKAGAVRHPRNILLFSRSDRRWSSSEV